MPSVSPTFRSGSPRLSSTTKPLRPLLLPQRSPLQRSPRRPPQKLTQRLPQKPIPLKPRLPRSSLSDPIIRGGPSRPPLSLTRVFLVCVAAKFAASLFISFRVPVAAVLVHFPLVSWPRPSMAAQMKTLLINFPQKTPNITIKTHFLPLNVYNLLYNRLYLP